MKQAYLTVDDSPSLDFESKMLFLRSLNLPALFFCIGRLVADRPREIIRAIENGFVIGNHSYSHRYFSDLSIDECKQEIESTEILIERSYSQSGIPRPGKFFRFPYFDSGGFESSFDYENRVNRPSSESMNFPQKTKRDEIQKFLRELGFRQPRFTGINRTYFSYPTLLEEADVRCTFDQCEYFRGTANAPWGLTEDAAILARIDEDNPFEGRSLNRDDTSDIVLIHDHEHTTDLFYTIVERYVRKGIRFQEIQ